MTPLAFPHVDAGQIDAFVRTLFRHADPGGYVQLRAFRDDADGTWRPEDWPAPQINGDLANVVDAAVGFAGECAAAPEVVVFCPPVATLKDARHAAEKDIWNGVALSADCDRSPTQAWHTLSAILGPATIVAASGGEWIDPSTSEIQPKLHLHWRLSRPTRTFAEHVKLKEARRAAMALIGSDASGVPLVHPLRWPGSWHRKGSPRLATIIEHNADIEIDLDVALARLVEEARNRTSDEDAVGSPATRGSEEGHQETAALIRAILRGEDYHGPISRLAMRYLMGGMPDAQVVESLRGIMTAVDPGIRDFKDGTLHRDRWLNRYKDIPRAVSSARGKLNEDQSDQTADNGARWPEPAPLLERCLEAAAPFPVDFLPGATSDFACDVADRMQCPVDFVGIPLIISAATVIGKEFRLAPKALDSWTERPCLWGGLISPVATMKTPAFNEALAPIRRQQHEFHKRHDQEIEQHKAKLSSAEYAERGWKEACRKALKAGVAEMPEKPEAANSPEPPQLRRLLTGDATQEALVDLIEQNPRGILLFRDELSAWFASFNQYRPGSDRQFYLECHSGGSHAKDRRLGAVLISDLFLNICGGFQPEIINKVLAGGDVDGMAARFSLLVWPDRVEDFAYVDREPSLTAKHKTEFALQKLLELDSEGFFGPERPDLTRALRFDEAAQQIFIEWYTKNQFRVRHGDENPALLAHIGKYPGLFGRLAIVHHLLCHVLGEATSPALVDAATAGAVERFIDDYLEPHARRIYRHLGDSPTVRGARRIAQWIVDNPALKEFRARDIRRNRWSDLIDQEAVSASLDYMENVAGWVRCTADLSGPKGGRPSSHYIINPMLRS